MAGVLTGWPVAAAAGAALGWFALRMAGASRRHRRASTDKIEALAVWSEMLRDGFAAGGHITKTVASTEDVAPLAIRPEVRRLCVRMRRPRPGAVEGGLHAFAAEVADPTADTIVIALLLAARGKGAQMETLLSTLAVSARAEVNMRLDIEAKRAEILGQRRMIIGTVVVFAGYLLVFRHSYLAPFGSALGQVVVRRHRRHLRREPVAHGPLRSPRAIETHHAARTGRGPVMTAMVVLGGLIGVGICLIVSGLAPAKATLAEVMVALDKIPGPPLPPPKSLDERVGRLLAGSVDATRFGAGRTRDLAMLDIDPSTFLGSKVLAGVAGLLIAPAIAALVALIGGGVSWQLPVLGAAGFAALGFMIPNLDVHAKAEARRRDFRRGLSAFLNVVTLALAAGELISGALRTATDAGQGWVFALVRRTLVDPDQRGITPWDALRRAGDDRGLDELSEVAASVRLAGKDGTQLQRTLEAKAEGLRARALADAQAEANEATTRMILPLVGIAFGFLLLVSYPAISHIIGGS